MSAKTAPQGTEVPPAASSFQRRLSASADAIEGFQAALEDEVEVRDRLILEAVDHGCPKRAVGRWARISESRVHQVVLRRSLEDQHEAERRQAAADADKVQL